jgi:two-component system nitrogen regulation response regulator NtrX
MAGEHILIVDDEPAIRSTLRDVLEDEGYRVSAVGGGADALRFFADELPDMTFLDIWMDRMDGLETLAEIKRTRPEAVVVMISGHGTIETAVKATRLGAYDFVEKPLSLEKILVTVSRALEHARLERENAALRASSSSARDRRQARRSGAARADATAAPTTGRADPRRERQRQGAGGARHPRAVRAPRPFVEVNCAAIPEG